MKVARTTNNSSFASDCPTQSLDPREKGKKAGPVNESIEASRCLEGRKDCGES